jgi:hypothetical protein
MCSTRQSQHCQGDSPRDATAHRGSEPEGSGDTPSNDHSLCALLQRRAACASPHPGPRRLSPGRAASRWLRPMPKPAPMTHTGPWRLDGDPPYSDSRRALGHRDWTWCHIHEAPSPPPQSRTGSCGLNPASVTCWRASPSGSSWCPWCQRRRWTLRSSSRRANRKPLASRPWPCHEARRARA